MTNPRSKPKNPETAGDVLSKTARTRVQEAYLRKNFGIKKDISNKYIDKGVEQEDESIKLFAKVSGIFGVTKNKEYFKNDHFIGTPDIITEDAIIDVKTAWSGDTYPWFDTELPNKDYLYQVLSYMDLTGKRKGYVAYCLTNASEGMIQDEIRRSVWRKKLIDPTDEQLLKVEDEVRGQMEFDHVPDRLRVKIFEIEYNETLLNSMKERVELCGEYYNELDALIQDVLKD